MPKKKILLVADTFYPKVDGILKFMEEFSRRSKDLFDIRYLVPFFGQEDPSATFVAPSRWISLSGYQNMKLSLKNLSTIKLAIRNSDIIFVQGPALLSFLGIYYGRKFQKTTIIYHHIYPWELFAKFVSPPWNKILTVIVKKMWIHLYNRCNHILVPYHGLVKELQRENVQAPITIARLGVDIQGFHPTEDKAASKRKVGLEPHPFVIGYVGRISKEKNIDVLVRAFKKMGTNRPRQLLLVGDGSEELKEKIMAEVPNCIITGFVNNVQDYLQVMDVFVMPSLTETTSLATLEAMSTGLPVICSKVGFMESYIIKNYNGLFFPKTNPSLLAIKLEKLLGNPDMRQKLGANARKTIAYSFSWERSINKIKRVIAQTAETYKETF